MSLSIITCTPRILKIIFSMSVVDTETFLISAISVVCVPFFTLICMWRSGKVHCNSGVNVKFLRDFYVSGVENIRTNTEIQKSPSVNCGVYPAEISKNCLKLVAVFLENCGKSSAGISKNCLKSSAVFGYLH